MQNPHPPLAESNRKPGLRVSPRLHRACAFFVVVVTPLLGLEPAQWRQQAVVEVPAVGAARIDLPLDVIDAAAANLADLRLLDPQGREAPFALVRGAAAVAARALAPRFEVKLIEGATVVTVRTETGDALLAAELATAPGDFMKSAVVEISADGEQWTALGSGLPVFSRGGIVRTRLPLNEQRAAFLRITLDDRKTPPLPITGVTLLPVAAAAPQPRTVTHAVVVSQREEFAGESVLTLDLGAEHLALDALELDTSAPAFSRPFTLTVRRLQDDVLGEQPLARGMLTRLPTMAASAPVVVTWAEAGAPPLLAPRELLVHIDNGDSPPLPLTAVAIRRRQREVVFTAEQAGKWMLLVGNPAATPPRYDIARFSAELPAVAQAVNVGRVTANPAYQAPPEVLADVALLGAALDPSGWSYRRPLVLGGGGVQQLELDLGVLAHAQTDFADVRLISGGYQIPYLIEPTALTREFAATIAAADDPRRPQVSRWRVVLPQTGLPLRRLVLATNTPLFQRRLRLLESFTDTRGQDAQRLLAEAVWTRQPKQAAQTLVLALDGQRLGSEVMIETDNGDNPPLALTTVRGAVGVTRLLFKPAEGGPTPELLCGNKNVGAARYDLVLIAPQILGATKHRASLGDEATQAGAGALEWVKGRTGLVVLWVVLAGVVVVLLVVVARLLPKPESQP